MARIGRPATSRIPQLVYARTRILGFAVTGMGFGRTGPLPETSVSDDAGGSRQAQANCADRGHAYASSLGAKRSRESELRSNSGSAEAQIQSMVEVSHRYSLAAPRHDSSPGGTSARWLTGPSWMGAANFRRQNSRGHFLRYARTIVSRRKGRVAFSRWCVPAPTPSDPAARRANFPRIQRSGIRCPAPLLAPQVS